MLEVKINDEVFNIKQKPSEFTIGEYEELVIILKDNESDQFDRYYNLFLYLGIPQYYLDEFDFFNFKEIIEEYNKQTDDITMINEVTIDGRLFRAYENEFKMSVKQMKKAIDYIKKDDKKCMAEVLGVIFQEVSKTKEENWLESNINERIELFRKNMTADVASPYFLLLIKKAINK